MKIILIIILLLLVIMPAQAQSPAKRVCADNPYGGVWNTTIRQAVAQFNRVTPSVWVASECDIVIVVTNDLPCGSGYLGCAYPGDPVQVYVLANYSQRLSNLLHELAHAYGMWDHVNNVPSVTNQGFTFYRRLTAYDIEVLRAMYPQ